MKLWRIFLLMLIIGCHADSNQHGEEQGEKEMNTDNIKFFEKIEKEQTGISFNNKLIETTEDNIILNDGFYQGAGVGILDVNNDGLPDIYFAGNQVSDRLYLNKGNWKFEDISERSPFGSDKDWSTGVSIIDINSDGLDDIYVCKFLYDDSSRNVNKLYINKGDLSFEEKGEEYNLADSGHSIMSNFFDYDNDGDLDVYLCNQPPSTLFSKKKLAGSTHYEYTDKLYRNDNGRFTDVTKSAGITNYNYSLSASTGDFNNDGWMDIYVACDYEEPDILLINNGDGTFDNQIHEAMKHIGTFSMGADIADIDNDGFMDIYTVDMVAEDNYRQKTNMSGMNPKQFWNLVNLGFHHQYMFNALQLNNGNGTFSEIAQMAGISNTDWSWAPLFMDIDNDGLKDILISNGLYKDIRNKDFEKKKKKVVKSKNNSLTPEELLNLTKETPSVKIQNYTYKNLGQLKFEKMNHNWGVNEKGWSQGMVYADLDNDGDLDLVMSNTNQEASFYKNNSIEKDVNNYINIIVKGRENNLKGIGSRIKITSNGVTQTTDHTPYRGYMSSSQNIVHFGLGSNKTCDIEVKFNDGKSLRKEAVQGNRTITINYSDAINQADNEEKITTLFSEKEHLKISHKENAFDDYEREVLIPYKLSSLGPVLEVADINKDGSDDFYIGGSVGHPGAIYISDGRGSFEKMKNSTLFEKHKFFEDGVAKFFDFNEDGYEDLFVGSGGNEYKESKNGINDRIYFSNEGKDFNEGIVITEMPISTGSVSVIDFDQDGDNDIFIGGRQVPGEYGRSTDSNLFEYTNNTFMIVNEKKAPLFNKFGMVTSSLAANITEEKGEELIISGEWMDIGIYRYNGEQFEKKATPGLEKTNGMWNVMQIEDLDGDGNLDIVAGNLGLNNKYLATTEKPFKLFVNDFDENGTNDVYLGFNQDGKTYPVRGRQCSSEQMPFVAEKFETYDVFGKSTVEDVLEGKEEGMTEKEAFTFAHTIFYGDGKGGFEPKALPNKSQISPVHGIVVYDFDGDGDKDLFTAGNYHDREVETTRSDAGVGSIIINEGNRKWKVMHPTKTGIIANGDVRAVKLLKQKTGKPILAIANNNAPMQFYQLN